MTNRLKPFFCYYGGKWRSAKRYPLPKQSKIIEPFAGSAGYALTYYLLDVELYDLDENIVTLWDYLIKATPDDIDQLPETIPNDFHIDDFKGPQGAKYLIGWWLNKGAAAPCKTPSAWMRSGIRPASYWGPEIKARIKSQVDGIKHWKIHHKSYTEAPNEPATWFVDPPYNNKAGTHYRHSSIDFVALAKWCKSREGQVIVCENYGAEWLPFDNLMEVKSSPSSRGKGHSKEVYWTNNY